MTPSQPPVMTDAERELFIKDCAKQMEQCMKSGNREAAMGWLQAQRQAIAARSPEQLALLVAEEERRLDEGIDYFAQQGAAARRDLDRLAQIEREREEQGDRAGGIES